MEEFRTVDPGSAVARQAMGHYFDEIGARFGFVAGTALDDAVTAYSPPRGVFVVSGPDDAPLACGAVQFLDDDRGEVKRMWVAPRARGRGLAASLLQHLEQLIRDAGRSESLLDTNSTLAPAVGLYTSRGYVRVADYNGNPHADVWFAKRLEPRP